jgi:glycine/D-amino acid oxidase-like deaminating enzyme
MTVIPYSAYSYWEKERMIGPWDFVIIGAGVTGLNAAIELKRQKPKLRVLVLEAKNSGAVASSRSAGFLCLGSPSEQMLTLEALGEAAWLHWTAAKWAGIQRLLRLLGSKSMMYRRVKAFEIVPPPGAFRRSDTDLDRVAQSLQEMNALMQRVDSHPLPFRSERKRDKATEVPLPFPYYGEPIRLKTQQGWGMDSTLALPIAFEGQVHPMLLVDSLKRYATNLGIQLLNGFPVESLGPVGEDLQDIFLDNQLIIKSKNIIICTNALTNALLPTPQVIPQRGQVLVSAPIPGGIPERLKGNFHGDAGYLYYRNLGNDRLLLGGARNLDFQGEQTDRWAENPAITQHLTDYALQVLGLKAEGLVWEQAWSGTMGFTPSGIPHLQALGTHRWLVAGMNGMGMALGPEMGRRVARWALAPSNVDPQKAGLLP